MKGDACEENAVAYPAYDAVCVLKLLWFGLVIDIGVDKVYDSAVGVAILSMAAAAAVIWCIKLE